MGTLSNFRDFGDGTISNENSPSHIFTTKGEYKVILITNPNSVCADTTQALISFEHDVALDTLFVPNVFTPNADGKNDFFEIPGANNPCIDVNRLTILNRWGKKVFETEESTLKWDGTINGKAVTDGIYYYFLEGESLKRFGSVSLIK